MKKFKCKDAEAVDAEANRTREGRTRTRICTHEQVFACESGCGKKTRVSTSLVTLPPLTVDPDVLCRRHRSIVVFSDKR